jgi:hypothetical protein
MNCSLCSISLPFLSEGLPYALCASCADTVYRNHQMTETPFDWYQNEGHSTIKYERGIRYRHCSELDRVVGLIKNGACPQCGEEHP